MPIPLTCQKALFLLPSDQCYLNSAFMGPLPIPVQQAGLQALAARASPIGLTSQDFFEPAERTRNLCAKLVNADPERVAFVPTVAYAMAIVAKNIHPTSGQNVVLLGEMFPSNVYPWRNWRANGVEMRTVAAPAASVCSPVPGANRTALWNEMLLQAIDVNTAVVAVEPAHWTDGTLFDLDRIGTHCRANGAAFVIDATQTVGAIPIDVARLRPDALVVHSYKSMLSNYGLGLAVFSDRFLDASPLEESWLMRMGSENFARLVDYEDRYAQGMRRFDTSVRANPILIAMLEAACKLLLEWQPHRVREYLFGIERGAIERARALGFEVADECDRAANLFGIKLPVGMGAEACRQQLAQRRIHVAVRGSSVRVSPHMYNDENDLAQLVDSLALALH